MIGILFRETISAMHSFAFCLNTVTLKSGGVDTVYHLWEYKGTEGANRVNFIIANK